MLTLDAHTSISRIERQYEPAELENVKRPGDPPQPGTTAYVDWLDANDRWVKSKDYAQQVRQCTLLGVGLTFSFIIQVAITAWVVLRLARRMRRERERNA